MRILIAEDQPELRRMLVKNLTAVGYTVDGVPDGAEALAYLDAAAYDAAVLDIMMPRVDGLTVLRTLRARGSALPVLLLTARDAVADRVDGLDAGADDYLIKPFDYNRFQSALQKFVARREAFAGDKAFNQEELDKVISPEGQRSGQLVDKGIHPVTLEIICSFLREHKSEKLSIEDIAKNVSLSRVTLRRYMNYLIDKNSVIGGVDYSTGGRPSAVYTYIGK